jgi:hypothetical protein
MPVFMAEEERFLGRDSLRAVLDAGDFEAMVSEHRVIARSARAYAACVRTFCTHPDPVQWHELCRAANALKQELMAHAERERSLLSRLTPSGAPGKTQGPV